MEEELREENQDELVVNKIRKDTTLTFGDNGRPEQLITVKDNKVNVKTLQVSMSRRHRVVMFLDLWTIAWVAGLTVGMSMETTLSHYVWIIAPIGFLVLLCAIGKTVVDFQNWLFTMNMMQAKMGDRYMDDVVGICQDFINAGAKFAAEEVKKVVEETDTEATNGEGAAANP